MIAALIASLFVAATPAPADAPAGEAPTILGQAVLDLVRPDSPIGSMPVVRPDPQTDYRGLVLRPDTGVHYHLLVVPPEPSLPRPVDIPDLRFYGQFRFRFGWCWPR